MAPIEPTLHDSQLRDRWRELCENAERATTIAGGLTPSQLWERPRPQRWSVGECLDHLVRAQERYLEVIDESIEEGRRRGLESDEPARLGLLGKILVHGVEPPARLKIPAPKSIRPVRPKVIDEPGTEDPDAPPDPRERFQEHLLDFAERLEAADGLDLGRVRTRSPFVPLITVTLDAALRIVTGHQRRHLVQAENALAGR